MESIATAPIFSYLASAGLLLYVGNATTAWQERLEDVLWDRTTLAQTGHLLVSQHIHEHTGPSAKCVPTVHHQSARS